MRSFPGLALLRPRFGREEDRGLVRLVLEERREIEGLERDRRGRGREVRDQQREVDEDPSIAVSAGVVVVRLEKLQRAQVRRDVLGREASRVGLREDGVHRRRAVAGERRRRSGLPESSARTLDGRLVTVLAHAARLARTELDVGDLEEDVLRLRRRVRPENDPIADEQHARRRRRRRHRERGRTASRRRRNRRPRSACLRREDGGSAGVAHNPRFTAHFT